MNQKKRNTWQEIHQEILHRIRSRAWSPGELIPNEVELAEEFGCARATINRALRAAAESGLLERRRKAGTRVTAQPAHKAVLRIPVLRQEIESNGGEYSYKLLSLKTQNPTLNVRDTLKLTKRQTALHLRALHFSDGRPFVLEDRWINLATVPSAKSAPFKDINANEWLLANAPFTRGEVRFGAKTATKTIAKTLLINDKEALFEVTRTTWNESKSITHACLTYTPGHCVTMHI